MLQVLLNPSYPLNLLHSTIEVFSRVAGTDSVCSTLRDKKKKKHRRLELAMKASQGKLQQQLINLLFDARANFHVREIYISSESFVRVNCCQINPRSTSFPKIEVRSNPTALWGLLVERFKLWTLRFNKSWCKFARYFNYALQKKRGQRGVSC